MESLISIDEKHRCTLTPPEDVLVTFINNGSCVIFRRKLKTYFMINEKSAYAREFFKSSTQVEKEKKKHLRHYYFMIHPFSKAKEIMDIFIVVVLIISIFTFRINNTLEMDFYTFESLWSVFLIMDIIRNFFTGIHRDAFNDTILAQKKVAKIYVKTWFSNDVLSAFPTTVLGLLPFGNRQRIIYAFTSTILKLSRILKLVMIVNTIQRHQKFDIIKFKISRLIAITLMIVVWSSYTLLLINQVYPETWFLETNVDNYLIAIKRNFYLFFLFGVRVQSNGLVSLLWEIVIMLCGYTFYAYSSVQFFNFMRLYNLAVHLHQSVKSQVLLFGTCRHLPEILRYRLKQYFDFRFPTSYYNEDVIRKTMSVHLKKQIAAYTVEKVLMPLNIFREVPGHLLTELTVHMQYKIYLHNDIIYKEKLKGNFLHCILCGTACVYTQHGKEVCHLHERDYFGEPSYVEDDTILTVVAINQCKIFRVSFEVLQQILASHRLIQEGVMTMIKERMQRIREKAKFK